ncbi:MAG: TauD/TfdA family dioxygenase [Alphaproteobacteria bacterium]
MSAMVITPVAGKTFGAVVTGVRLAGIDDGAFASIHEAFLEYGFLCFPGQFLTEQQNVDFCERFGPLEFGPIPMANRPRLREGEYGDTLDLETQVMRINIGNEAWHTDSTYRLVSSKCAMLSAVEVPDAGGETELADCRAAWTALDAATKRRIAHLAAYHASEYSQANDLGDFPPIRPDSIFEGNAYLRPLVKLHPETGGRSIFVARHAFGIPGLGRDESRALLQALTEFIVSEPSRVYAHHWQPGDSLLWDNRCLLHRARPYDYARPRVLIATRVAGDPASEIADNPTGAQAEAGRRALAAELAHLRDEVTDRRYRGTTAAEAVGG